MRFVFTNIIAGLFFVILCHHISFATCVISFPGVTELHFSDLCVTPDNNMFIGSPIRMGDGDMFIFDSPSTIDISGNISLYANGSGKIIIPAGVTVNVGGNLELFSDGGCIDGGECTFEFIVNGDLIILGNFRNHLKTLVFSGTGTVDVGLNFRNNVEGCMECGTTCPAFPSSGGNCADDGIGCPGDFCTDYYGNTTPIGDNDTDPPTIINCPSDQILNAVSSCEIQVSWTSPTAFDNVGIAYFISTHSPGDYFQIGTTTVIYTAEDLAGNVTTCSFDITIVDDLPPTFSGCPSDIPVSISSGCTATASWTPPVASDNCILDNVSSSHTPGETFTLGTTNVVYMATDTSGNIGICSFNVIILDEIDPVISDIPSDVTQDVDAGLCGATVTWTAPTATDNCSVSSLVSDYNSGDFFPVGTTTVTYTATDGSGNIDVQTFDITINDNIDPVISGMPADIMQGTDAGLCGATVTWTAPTASDNCSVSSLVSDYNSGDFFPVGTTTVTYTATDPSGNTDVQSFDITINDDIDPVISGMPVEITQNVDAGLCGATVTWTAPTASDNCNVSSLVSDYDPGDFFPVGTTMVTYTATDDYGNTDVQTFDITVNDNIDPFISDIPTDIIQDVDAGLCGATVTWTAPTASDNCNVSSLVSDYNSGDFFPVGTTTVIYTATDDYGNTNVQTFDITINDNINPVISGIPADFIQNVDAGLCGATINWAAPTASDNCSVSSLVSNYNSGDFFPVGTTTVTYTATDPSGNTDVQTFDITINDNIDPVISGMPTDIIQGADAGLCGATVTWTAPTASENCNVSSLVSDHNPGDFFPVGTTTVTYTATDPSGNTDVQSFDITVNDNIDPVISNCPDNMTVSITGSGCTEPVSWAPPTADDNCIIQEMISSHSPGDDFSLGTTTVTYTATDVNGNVAICSFDVTVIDETPPVIANCPDDITVSITEGCMATVEWTPPTAIDNCELQGMISSHSPGDDFPLGTTTVTYTATDVNGNVSTCSFDIIVIDEISPIISNCPDDITASITEGCMATAEWTLPTATDNCQLEEMSSSHSPGDEFPLGTTTVTYTATDESGNVHICSFDVIVRDMIPPEVADCPEDIVVQEEGPVNWAPPVFTDNCGVEAINATHQPGDRFSEGTTQVTYTSTDSDGNTSECSFMVTVEIPRPPVISDCPQDQTIEIEAGCSVDVSWTPPTAEDEKGITSFISTHSPGDEFPVGITTVTYTAENLYGLTAECSFDISVVDALAPEFSNCPEDIVVNTTGPVEITWIEPVVTDNCDEVRLTSTNQPGAIFQPGSTLVTYTATDRAGNSSQCTFEVTNIVNHPPVIDNRELELTDVAGIEVCFNASDPDGDEIILRNLLYDETAGNITDVDSIGRCFYFIPYETTSEDIFIEPVVCDNGIPEQCSTGQIIIKLAIDDPVSVSKFISPDNDSYNDFWIIQNIEWYPENHVSIFDRWGSLVFEASGYDNQSVVWGGKANTGIQTGKILPTSTYFYVVQIKGHSDMKGYVELVR